MAEGKRTVVIYTDWKQTFDYLSDDDAGKLIKHLMSYVNDENPPDPEGMIGMAWVHLKAQLKRDLEKYEAICEKRKLAGKKSAEAKAANADKTEQTEQVSTSVESVESVDTSSSTIPTREDLITYMKEKGKSDLDPEWLWNKIESWKENGWKDGFNKPIKNWKLKITTQFSYCPKKEVYDPYKKPPSFIA